MSERKIRQYALSRCAQRRVYVDIGAAVGHTCHPFIGEFDCIHAFEPNTESYSRLTQTIERCRPVIMIESKRGENLALMPYEHTVRQSQIIWYPRSPRSAQCKNSQQQKF